MTTTLITARHLVDGTGRPPISDAALVIKDDRIAFVGPRADAVLAHPVVDSTIDAGEATLLPGLIDGHVHLAGAWVHADRHRLESDPSLLSLLSIGAAQEVLRSGVTTIADCGAPNGITLTIRDAIQSGYVVGPRVYACGPSITTTAGHGDYIGIGAEANNADELRYQIRYWVRKGADFIKIMATGGSADPPTMRRRAQYTEAELAAGIGDAHRLGKRVVAHVNATEGIRNSVRAGVDVLAHCNWLGSADDTVEFDEDVARRAADQGTIVDLNAGGALPPLQTRDGRVINWRGPAVPRCRWDLMLRMRELGVEVYFATDGIGAEIAEFPDLLCRTAEGASLAPLEMVHMATQLPARGLGLEKDLGTLEAGKIADVLAVAGDVAADGRALTRPQLVLRSGRVVVDHGLLVVAR